jgi:glutamate racemase
MSDRPIGVFDSGIGGLSVWREIRRELPAERLLYLADQAHVPYGRRSLEEILALCTAVTRFFLEREAKLVVLACNTASAAALHPLRGAFPKVPFVGMEPAVKPAAQETRTGKVAVIATEATFQSQLFAGVVERFAEGVEVFQQACPGLVERIEGGDTDSPELRARLAGWIRPLVEKGIDRLVLGCTHYPLVRAAIESVAGPNVQVIDPSPAIARQTKRVLERDRLLAAKSDAAPPLFLTTGPDAERFRAQVRRFVAEASEVCGVRWERGKILDSV